MEAHIYSFINKEKLADLVSSFNACIGLPMQVLDENGKVLEHYGAQCQYCKHFTAHLSTKDTCAQIHATAGHRAMTLGEAYIFSCHSNLCHIVFPLSKNEHLFGSVLVGPFLMNQPDSTMILDIGKRYTDFSMEDLMTLYDDTSEIPQVEPAKVTEISKLLYFLFSNLVTDAKEQLVINQAKLYQQARISESIHMYKQEDIYPDEYPFEKEQELLHKVKIGDLKQSRALLNDLLGYVFLATGNSIDVVKNRSLELCSLLSRAAMESGAPPNQILKINNHFIKNLQNYNTVEDLCYSLGEILTTFVESLFPTVTSKNNKIIQDAMSYISANYASNLTLNDVANYVHLNPAYLSRIFKQVCGSSFKEYLTMIRVEESKRLLKNTSYSLLDIAIATGFEDQSYFSRVFKKQTGLTPKQFRS